MIDKLKELGAGYRTYGVVAVLLLCVAAEKLLGWDVPGFTLTEDWLSVVLGALGLGSLRAAVGRK